MSNDTIDKIDDAIKKIQGNDLEFSSKIEDVIRDDTNNKLFNNGETNQIDSTKEVKNIKDVEEIISEDIVVYSKNNLKYYVLYFLLLGIVVLLIILFMVFLYK